MDLSIHKGTFAWIHAYIMATKDEIISEIQDYEEEELVWKLFQRIDPTKLNETDKLSTLLRHLVDVQLDIVPLWNEGATLENTLKIVTTAITREAELLESGKYVFFHAQNSGFALLNFAIKAATNRHLRKTTPNKETTLSEKERSTAVERAIKLGLRDICDDEPCLQHQLLSVNYSLFGNYGAQGIGESTLHYLVHNYSQTFPERFVKDIPFTTKEEQESILAIIKNENA